MTDGVRVEGLARLNATLSLAARRILDMSEPLRASGAYVSTRGRSSAPHLTGRLAASVRSSNDRETLSVGSGLEYANRTHWGYARYSQRPQPFLYDAVRNGESVIVDHHMRRVDSVVSSIKGK